MSCCRPCLADVPKPQRGGISFAEPKIGLYAPGPGVGGALLESFRRAAAEYFGPLLPLLMSYAPGPGVIDRARLTPPRPEVPKPNLGVL